MSRALTILITLRHMVNLTNNRFYRPSGVRINRCLAGPLQNFKVRAMSTVTDEDINDPKRHLDYKQFVERKNKENVVVVDVREESEIKETGKIPGSINIPLNDLVSALAMSDEEFLKKYHSNKPKLNSEIIFSCRSGRRSFAALKHALEAGYKNAKNFKGGWLDWEKHTRSSS